MWKPGSSKPKEKADEVNKEPSSKNAITKASPKKASLSGATLNMRFMQKSAAIKPTNERIQEVIAPPHETTTTVDSTLNVVQEATIADMYGVQAIGRRSFGGFHQSIETAWRRSDNKSPKVSDEAMLQRYQDFVHGREQNNPPIGNLQVKNNKRQKKQKTISNKRQKPDRW